MGGGGGSADYDSISWIRSRSRLPRARPRGIVTRLLICTLLAYISRVSEDARPRDDAFLTLFSRRAAYSLPPSVSLSLSLSAFLLHFEIFLIA